MRLAGGVGAELQQHRWLYIAGAPVRSWDQGLVVQNDRGWLPALRFGIFQRQIQRHSGRGDSRLEQRERGLFHPLLEPFAGSLAACVVGLDEVGSRILQVNLRPERGAEC